MRTVIAPLDRGVQEQIEGLDRKRAEIARRYIRRLALEPYLGYRLERGSLAEEGCRAVRFDRDDNPDDLFGARRPAIRRGDQDLRKGPRWRIVYWCEETSDRSLRLIVVLAVGIAHPEPGKESAFDLAARLLKTIIKEKR